MAIKPPTDSVCSDLAKAVGISQKQVRAAADLLIDGNTIPFIARYRKEATGGLDEIQLRAIEDALEKANTLAARKATILKTIQSQGLLTDELRRKIDACTDITDLETIYLPFKPKRQTRGSIAREKGLGPLAELLIQQDPLSDSKHAIVSRFVDADREVPDVDAALAGAMDIVAEQWSENAEVRQWMNQHTMERGKVCSKVKRGKKAAAEKFESYVDHQEPVGRIPSHRLLAMLRGEAEGVLKVTIDCQSPEVIRSIEPMLIRDRSFPFYRELKNALVDCVDRLLGPATQSLVLKALKASADEEAIAVFGKNLQDLLMAPPAGPRTTIGIDPGFRTGCKVAVIDATGKYLANTTIYPTPPKNDVEKAGQTLLSLIKKHDVELIAIGNGTASRETDAFVADLIVKHALSVSKVMVSESGASIYSASELAGKEFPDLDITVRGAISIARRLQDPLAELVKTDPKSIGVGQYQHDVNQSQLRKCLDRTVESCVNQVGVDLSMASVPLLSHVSGIGTKLADNIVQYRNEHGRFDSRDELVKVPKLGKKAYQQAAGFLRIRGGKQPLDDSAVHPECYAVVDKMAKQLGVETRAMVGNQALSKKLQPVDFVDDQFGVPTITDILDELARPGRDPRSEFRVAKFDDQVNEISDLKPDMVLEGVITNVTHFGAFVDVGVHQDGLIHISQLSNTFVKDPSEIVSVGDVVKVKVVEVDQQRKRIAMTRKF